MSRGNTALRALAGVFKGAYKGMDDYQDYNRQAKQLGLQERQVAAQEAAANMRETPEEIRKMERLGIPVTAEGYGIFKKLDDRSSTGAAPSRLDDVQAAKERMLRTEKAAALAAASPEAQAKGLTKEKILESDPQYGNDSVKVQAYTDLASKGGPFPALWANPPTPTPTE